MHFCPLCSSILLPEQAQTTQLCCSACPYSYRLTTVLSYNQTNKPKSIEKTLGGDKELKYANKCAAKCPKCSHEEAMFMEIQTRSADEPMTIFYQCTKCKFDWKE